MDVVKIIEPILRPQKIKNAGPVRTVILDAGHGGIDSGATGPLGKEKDATLDVVIRAKKLLQENGYQVRCTRLTDLPHPAGETRAVRQPPCQRHLRQRPFQQEQSRRGDRVWKPTVLHRAACRRWTRRI